jgi:centromeric protein E
MSGRNDTNLDGQTSSGKTFTMLGAPNTSGVLELAAIDLFKYMAECSNRDFIVRVSFVEIYNEVTNSYFCNLV